MIAEIQIARRCKEMDMLIRLTRDHRCFNQSLNFVVVLEAMSLSALMSDAKRSALRPESDALSPVSVSLSLL